MSSQSAIRQMQRLWAVWVRSSKLALKTLTTNLTLELLASNSPFLLCRWRQSGFNQGARWKIPHKHTMKIRVWVRMCPLPASSCLLLLEFRDGEGHFWGRITAQAKCGELFLSSTELNSRLCNDGGKTESVSAPSVKNLYRLGLEWRKQ